MSREILGEILRLADALGTTDQLEDALAAHFLAGDVSNLDVRFGGNGISCAGIALARGLSPARYAHVNYC